MTISEKYGLKSRKHGISIAFSLNIICYLFFFPFISYGRQITPSQSLSIAQQFYHNRVLSGAAKVKSTHVPVFSLDYTVTENTQSSRVKALSVDSTALFYVYNISDNQGFIIVSGDDATKPILAYSDESQFPAENIPSHVKYWLDFYKEEINSVRNSTSNATTTALQMKSAAATVVVQPLLGNLKWDQSGPYNLLCPFSVANNARAVTGCVATAMSQLMKYYQWPVKGTGSFSYTDGTNGTLSANFGNTSYDWNNMLSAYGTISSTPQQDTAVATLMYQCGVSVSMTYSPASSSAQLSAAASALKNYFGYDTDLNIYTRNFYTTTDWKNLIKPELNAARPVLYGGSTNTEGHAFVVDGYDSNDLFHINWGWSGYYNGYFELSLLNPAPSGSIGSTGGFSQDQQLITGIQKPDAVTGTTYPIYMYSAGLATSKSSIQNISASSFNVTFGFLNYGISGFSGKVAIALYKDGVFQKTLSASNAFVLNPNYGSASFGLSGLSLAGLASGTYKAYCVYEASSASSWTIINGSNQLNDYLNIVISGTSANLSKPVFAPLLTLTQAVTLTGNVYQNKVATFNVTVQNTGTEFNSNMGIKIYSTSNSSVNQYINYGVVVVGAGETKNFTFRGAVTVNPGTYYAVAVCDSTNAFSSTAFKVMTPAIDNQIAITVLAQPATAALSLTVPVSLTSGSSIIAQNDPVTLNAGITNTGGFYDSDIIAFVFPSGGGNSVAYLNPQTIYIDTNETQQLSFTGTLDLNPGQYLFKLYSNISGWAAIPPYLSGSLDFTMISGVTTGSESGSGSSYSIYPNPVSDVMNLKGINRLTTISITDIHGRVLIKKEVNPEESIAVNLLPQGLYMVTLTTTETSTILKMLKK